MERLAALTGRNLKQYFRDRGAVFFSLLSMVIVICLMLFFLGDMNVDNMKSLLSSFPGRDTGNDVSYAELVVLTWTCAGILSINAVTVTQAVYSVMIKDRVNGKLNSFYTSPVSRTVIAGSYIAAAWVASLIVCTITLVVTEAYCVTKGLQVFSAINHVKLIGMIMVNSFAYASIMYLAALLARTEGAWSGIGTVVGTLVGFLGGIYIPIGTLADAVQMIMKCTPVIYGTAMFRSTMMQEVLDQAFHGVPDEVVREYRDVMGIDLTFFDRSITGREEWLILLVCGILFLLIGVWVLRFSKKTDR